ncbi:MAG: glycosyltransferase family 4 protein [Magnetococcales bacterium]|nr:glycosyltransferase family 4 protein [Magnetococcales bacterium]
MAKIFVLGSYAPSLINFRRVMLQEMVRQGHEVIAAAPDASENIISALKELGVIYHNVPLNRFNLNPLRDFSIFWKLFHYLRQSKPDIFLGYTIKPVIFGTLAAYFAGVPRIHSMITGTGYAFSQQGLKSLFVGWIAKFLYRLSLRCARSVFFQNPDDKNLFVFNHLIKHEKGILINGSGVDIQQYYPVQLPQDISFLIIARLLRDKGIYEYVEAARIVRQRNPEILFRIVGWLDKNPNCCKQEELDEWVHEGIIEYLGQLEDVRPAIAESSIYVLPSYAEGTPRTVLEAMAMGRPIITTDTPGCRETVKDGINGFLVPVKNVPNLVQAMEKFIAKPSLIKKMGEHSRYLD